MTQSLNEIDAMAKKAARGAGLPWGLAEETGRAVRWLTAQNGPGIAALAALLPVLDGDTPARGPVSATLPWQAGAGGLCPIRTGAALSDFAYQMQQAPVVTEAIHVPVLTVPFAAWAALQLHGPVCVRWLEVTCVTDGHRMQIDDPANQLLTPLAPALHAALGGALATPTAMARRGLPEDPAWSTVCRYAERTYAPATEASRRLGAGAGETDND